MTWRYVFVLAGEVAAHAAPRSPPAATAPRHRCTARRPGGVATALFLRAHGRGERVHVAMARARLERHAAARRTPRAHARRRPCSFGALAGLPLAARLTLEVTG